MTVKTGQAWAGTFVTLDSTGALAAGSPAGAPVVAPDASNAIPMNSCGVNRDNTKTMPYNTVNMIYRGMFLIIRNNPQENNTAIPADTTMTRLVLDINPVVTSFT